MSGDEGLLPEESIPEIDAEDIMQNYYRAAYREVLLYIHGSSNSSLEKVVKVLRTMSNEAETSFIWLMHREIIPFNPPSNLARQRSKEIWNLLGSRSDIESNTAIDKLNDPVT